MPTTPAPVEHEFSRETVMRGDLALQFDALAVRTESPAERCLLPILAAATVHWLFAWPISRVWITAQPEVAQVGRVDFLVELQLPPDERIRLVVEVDGLAYHQDQRAFAADRRRDRGTLRNGMLPVRFTMAELQDLGWWAVAELTNIGTTQIRQLEERRQVARRRPVAALPPATEEQEVPF